ncbi:MAG: hypothetical protein AB1324_04655 [Candidatus Micrarchaeota archaeon]
MAEAMLEKKGTSGFSGAGPLTDTPDALAKLREGGKVLSATVRESKTAAPTSGEKLRKGIDSAKGALAAIDAEKAPVLGKTFKAQASAAKGLLDEAGRALDEGNEAKAAELYGKATRKLAALSEVLDLELAIVSKMPAGLPGRLALDKILGALETTIEEREGPNRGRAETILKAARLYVANADIYNVENAAVRKERNALLDLVVERGAEARAGAEYTAESMAADSAALGRFSSNATLIREQVAQGNIWLLEGWRESISDFLRSGTALATKDMLEDLDLEIAKTLDRMRKSKAASVEEVNELGKRFYSLTGIPRPLTLEQEGEMLAQAAKDIRGSSKTPASAAELFGEHALAAIRDGNFEIASLAISMGLLCRAAGGKKAAITYLSPALFKEISDAIEKRKVVSPELLAKYSAQIEIAFLFAGCTGIESESPSKGPADKVAAGKRLRAAAGEIRRRILAGDIKGAKRLLDMADAYLRMLKSYKWKEWAGSKEIEAGIDAELAGGSGAALFERGMQHHEFALSIKDFRAAIGKWGEGLAGPKALLGKALGKAEELAKEGKFAEARKLLTLAVMYAEITGLFAKEKKGKLDSFNPSLDASVMGGMEKALEAAILGEGMSGGRPVENVFLASYKESQQTFITMEAGRFSVIAEGRPEGKETVDAAIAEAKKRSAAGDFTGAQILLRYVADYFGPAGSWRKEGWRYDLVTAPHNSKAEGFARGKEQLLEGIRAEVKAKTPDEHRSAALLVDAGVKKIATTEMLVNEAALLRQKFDGEIPLIDKEPDTKDMVPLGTRSGGKYPDYINLKDVRDYEAANPADAATAKGPTLKELLKACRVAAAKGDVEAYNTAVKRFNARFELVAGRVLRKRNLDEAKKKVGELGKGIDEIKKQYGSSIPGAVKKRLDALEKAKTEVIAKIDAIYNTTDDFPKKELEALASGFDKEKRIAIAYSLVGGQLEMNKEYRKMVSGGRGTLTSFAKSKLAESDKYLKKALDALAEGDTDKAMAEYKKAIYERRQGLALYEASNALTLRRSDSWKTGIKEGAEFVYDITVGGKSFDEAAADVGPKVEPGGAAPQYTGYQKLHEDVLATVLKGKLSKDDLSRIEGYLEAARYVDLSVFGIPADNMSQVLSDFVPDQKKIRDLVASASEAYRKGDFAEGKRILGDVKKAWEGMAGRAADNAWWGNAAAIGTGLAASLVPGIGWALGGAIFTTIAFDQVVTEISTSGEASAKSWAMLGVSVATVGLGAAAIGLGRAAALTAVAGEASQAAKLLAWSKGLSYVNLGIGSFMTGYMIGEAWNVANAYFDPKNTTVKGRDVILSAGMALFPLAHMTVSGIAAAKARSKAQVQLDLALKGVSESGEVKIKPTEIPTPELSTPEGVFRFLGELKSKDASVRAVAEAQLARLPPEVKATIESWANKSGVVKAALESGKLNDLAIKKITDGVKAYEPYLAPRKPGGSRAMADAARLTDPAELGAFVKDLLITDAQVAGSSDAAKRARVARSAARAALEGLKKENPEAAKHIEKLVSDPEYEAFRAGLLSGSKDAKINTTLSNTAVLIGSTLPTDLPPAKVAVAGPGEGVGTKPKIEAVKIGEPAGGAKKGPVAMGGDEKKGPPPPTPAVEPGAKPAKKGGGGAPKPSGADVAAKNAAELQNIEITAAGTAAKRKPWRLLTPEEKTAYQDEIFRIYGETYGKLGLDYKNPEELIGRLEAMAAFDSSGKLVGFMLFSKTGNGLRLGLIAAEPGSTEGRSAVYGMIEGFKGKPGMFGLVSERVAGVADRLGVPFMEFPEAQKLMGKPKGAEFPTIQRDIANIKKMEGYESTPMVKRAAERTGKSPAELTFEDIVDQAVLEREIPDTADARARCFAVNQTIGGERVVVIKLMMGKTL